MKIAVLGSGAWGTALAMLLQKNGHEVSLWSYCEEESHTLRERGENRMLPGVPLPKELTLTHREDVVAGCGGGLCAAQLRHAADSPKGEALFNAGNSAGDGGQGCGAAKRPADV